ncbi:MAG: glutamine synthetase family protein [Peptococcaceae bacterium]|nr:glutamine synthetase family protein [Peptococcaceae bacterium]
MANMDISTLKSMADRGEIDTVIIAAADMQARLFGKRCCADFFLSEAVHGINICSNNLIWDIELNEGGQYPLAGRQTGLPDLRAVPDMTTLRIYPWFEKTAMVMADLFHQDGTPVSAAPRNILKRRVEKAGKMGLQADMASEIEFYIFNETAETARDKNYRDLLPLSRMPAESIRQLSRYEHFLGKVRRNLNRAGVEVELARPERGRGQAEVNLRYAGALEMADRTAIYKNGIKEMADLEKLAVTFMAKYRTGEPASGFHVHMSLRDQKGDNIFYDPDDDHGMSPACKHFLAGMIMLAPELMCFYAPYINSYKRYGSTFGAPRNLSWGFDNRTLSFRLIGRGKSFRIENRIPGADANPYLVLAACLASGLYGIEHRMNLPFPPVRGSAYEMKDLRALPASLMDALKDFENSEIARELFGREVIDHYARAARYEIENFLASVTDWERRRNFEQV